MSLIVQKNVPLAEFTTFKIGGEARFFVSAKSENEVIETLKFAENSRLKIFILGGGSNILIADKGFDGLVLQIALKGIRFVREDENILVTAKAGEDWDSLVAVCVDKNLAGVECLSGIPGFTGGTPVQNVGAYGQEVSETIVSVSCFDRNARKIVELKNEECGFGYRASVFNSTEKNRYIVLAVSFALKLNGEPKIVYKELREFFGDKKPSLRETREAVLQIRRAKSMVIDKDDANSKSAGSFFKNPIVDLKKFVDIEERALKLQIENVPHFSFDEKRVKIPAAWLIEKSGFIKGYRFGNAGLSTNHTLAIVNLGGAKAEDILGLKREIEKKVKEKFDVELKAEPIFVGFE